MSKNSRKSLTVFCPLGLSNRLRVLLSGLALAEASGRRFRMLWPLTSACAAPFAALFANDWPVETVRPEVVAEMPYVSGWFGHLSDLLAASQPDLVVGHPTWLIRPGEYPGHDRLNDQCQRLFAELTPILAILDRIESFRHDCFQKEMIGVHLRRGDLLRQRPDVAHNTTQAIAALDQFQQAFSEAGIFLCTDDGAIAPDTGRATPREGVREVLSQRYGQRVVWTSPTNLDRNDPRSIQEALIDLWLLRAADAIVGTEGSSFSEMALFGRDVPHLLVAGATPGYRQLEGWARRTGIYEMLIRRGKKDLGIDAPFPALLRYYAVAPYRWARRIVKTQFSRKMGAG